MKMGKNFSLPSRDNAPFPMISYVGITPNSRVPRVDQTQSFVINGIFNVVPCGILLDNLDETSI